MERKRIPNFIIWNRLKALRQSRGLTQTQVAAGSGVSLATIWMLEQGFDRRTTPQIKKKLSRFYGVKTSDIFPVEVRGEDIIK
jgi:transcriptional regulator with XRE-family HTH domain